MNDSPSKVENMMMWRNLRKTSRNGGQKRPSAVTNLSHLPSKTTKTTNGTAYITVLLNKKKQWCSFYNNNCFTQFQEFYHSSSI